MIYSYLTPEQNQRMSLLKARAEARAEYSIQGICTDLFEDQHGQKDCDTPESGNSRP
jgi:hypothetical protein